MYTYIHIYVVILGLHTQKFMYIHLDTWYRGLGRNSFLISKDVTINPKMLVSFPSIDFFGYIKLCPPPFIHSFIHPLSHSVIIYYMSDCTVYRYIYKILNAHVSPIIRDYNSHFIYE